MACPECKDYMGRCGKCGADLRKATESEPIGKPVLPPRAPRPRPEPDVESPSGYADYPSYPPSVSRR